MVYQRRGRFKICLAIDKEHRVLTARSAHGFSFGFLQQVNALQIVKHPLPLEPILQWEILWLRVLRINNAAAYLVAGEELCRRTLVDDNTHQ